MVGYSDIASFSRAFKNYSKIPPKQYLRLNLEGRDPAIPEPESEEQ